MTAPWWTPEAGPNRRPRLRDGAPSLHPTAAADVRAELAARIPAYTPEWTNFRPDDAGVALVRLFGVQMEAVLKRLDRMPEKALGVFLDTYGIEALPASPAAALLVFKAMDSAPRSVFVPSGFGVQADPADDSDDPVVFETTRDLYAAPAVIDQFAAQVGKAFTTLEADASPIVPFGPEPQAGKAFLVGLAGERAPTTRLSLAFLTRDSDAPPAPVSAGAPAPPPALPAPSLAWELLDGGRFKPLEVISDSAAALTSGGIVELGLPKQWRAGTLPGRGDERPLRWLRVRLLNGQYPIAPRFEAIHLNAAPALAAVSIRNEVLEPVKDGDGRIFRLARTPVLADSLVIEVDESPLENDPFGVAEGSEQAVKWTRIGDLGLAGPNDRVYDLDPAAGIVRFGDGVNGAAIPRGFRHVRARIYRAGGGRRGAVEAEAIDSLARSLPFLQSAVNPKPATGGVDPEPYAATLQRGPETIRARGRAVTAADYALLAKRAPGAHILRAHAVSGLHPNFPGAAIPGVVAVFPVPPVTGDGPPTPSGGALRAVAEYLSREVAPMGVEVVAAPPAYHRVRVAVTVRIAASADAGAAITAVIAEINRYLDPLAGGESGRGWPFGGALRFQRLTRRLLGLSGVRAVPRLNLIADGIRLAACADFQPEPNRLLWPESHEVFVEHEEGS